MKEFGGNNNAGRDVVMTSQTIKDKQQICLSCQKCCNGMSVTTRFKHDNISAVEFYKARGIETVINKDGYIVTVFKNMPCPQLTPLGCKVYHDRPVWCMLYDGRNCPVMKGECEW